MGKPITRKANKAKANRSKAGPQVVRNLGVDYSCGARLLARPVQAERWRSMAKRMPFVRRLRQVGANMVAIARSALVPALSFGTAVVGMPPAALAAARSMVRHSLVQNVKGRSADIDLALAGPSCDPAWLAFTKLVFAFSLELWNQWIPRGEILRGMSGAMGAQHLRRNL